MGHSSPALAVVSQARGRRACHMFSNRLSPGQAIFRPCTVIPSEIDILMNVRGRSLHVRPPFCALRWVASWHDEQGGGQRAAGSGQRAACPKNGATISCAVQAVSILPLQIILRTDNAVDSPGQPSTFPMWCRLATFPQTSGPRLVSLCAAAVGPRRVQISCRVRYLPTKYSNPSYELTILAYVVCRYPAISYQ